METKSGHERKSRCQSQLQPVALQATRAERKYLNWENEGLRGRNTAKRCFSDHCVRTLP